MALDHDKAGLQWELQPSGVWTGASGRTVVAMVAPDSSGRFEWRLRIVSGPIAQSSGKDASAAAARSEAQRHWSAWIDAHGLAPEQAPTADCDTAFRAAVAAYRRHKEMVMAQDGTTHDMVLVRTILDVHASSLSSGAAIDDAAADDILLRNYMAAQDAKAESTTELNHR